MGLANLTESELGHIVRDGPLWQILLEMEKKDSPADQARQHSEHVNEGSLKQPMPQWCDQCHYRTNEENLRCKACRVPSRSVIPYKGKNGNLEAIEFHEPIKRPAFFSPSDNQGKPSNGNDSNNDNSTIEGSQPDWIYQLQCYAKFYQKQHGPINSANKTVFSLEFCKLNEPKYKNGTPVPPSEIALAVSRLFKLTSEVPA